MSAPIFRDFDHHEVVLPFLYVHQDGLHQVYQDEIALWRACAGNFPDLRLEQLIATLQQHECEVRWIRTATDAAPLRPVLAIPEAEFQEARTRIWEAMDKTFPGVEFIDWGHTKTFIYVDRTRRRRAIWCRGDDVDVDLPREDPRYSEVYDRMTALFNAFGQRLAADLDAEFFL